MRALLRDCCVTLTRAQAKRRRTHYRAFTAWKAWDQFLKMKKGLRFVKDKIAYHPALLSCIRILPAIIAQPSPPIFPALPKMVHR